MHVLFIITATITVKEKRIKGKMVFMNKREKLQINPQRGREGGLNWVFLNH
jgi:hypothetical protein